MSVQHLFYRRPAVVSPKRHARACVELAGDYSFARSTNTVPLTAVEFPHAAGEYAIVFAGTGDALMPAVLLGLRPQQNLHVDAGGTWTARYVPAFVRRYPFVFSSGDDGRAFTLCIDEGFPGFNDEGRGEALFDPGGERTAYLQRVLKFLEEYQAQFQRTRALCEQLSELDLLDPVRADFKLASGERTSLAGFRVVNRAKLKALDGERLAALARSDALELAFLQMHSLRNLQRMRETLGASVAITPGAPDSADRATDASPPQRGGAKAGGNG